MKELLYLKDDQLKEFIEKIFVSYRETFSDAKKILDKYSIGVAHHKVIHLLSLYEGITISELLKKLKVTKQSLNRVLKDLIQLEAIEFKKDKKDTRIKHVYLSDKGLKLFEELFSRYRLACSMPASAAKKICSERSYSTDILVFKFERAVMPIPITVIRSNKSKDVTSAKPFCTLCILLINCCATPWLHYNWLENVSLYQEYHLDHL